MRHTHVAARRCAGALVLSMSALVPTAAADPLGGGVYVAQPKVAKVTCVSRCASKKRAQGGSTIAIRGTGLAAAETVLFQGGYGERDDVSMRCTRAATRGFRRAYRAGRSPAR